MAICPVLICVCVCVCVCIVHEKIFEQFMDMLVDL